MTIRLIRKGHLGDVILTEPVARALKTIGHSVVLVTEYLHVAKYLASYDHAEPYSAYEHLLDKLDPDLFVVLAYELHPELHYVQGFAKCAGVVVPTEQPNLRGGFAPVTAAPYCLIAPDTSTWFREMREWSRASFNALALRIREEFELRVVFLEPSHSFEDMLSLIENCTLFIGNDSGPSIIAQAYNKRAVVLFGCTDYSKVICSPMARPIFVDVGCNGCRQRHRNTPFGCTAPICLEGITVDLVVRQAAALLNHSVMM